MSINLVSTTKYSSVYSNAERQDPNVVGGENGPSHDNVSFNEGTHPHRRVKPRVCVKAVEEAFA
jgi:hypothetical protein